MRYSPRIRETGSPFNAVVGRWGQRSVIKSIQYGVVNLTGVNSNTATITTVNTGTSVLVALGNTNNTGGYTPAAAGVRLAFTNSTTITGTRGSASGNDTAQFMVIEFFPGVLKSLQYNTAATSGTSTTTTLTTTVDASKAALFSLGWENNSGAGSGELDNIFSAITLTNGTTVTLTIGGQATAATVTHGFCVAEFF